MNCPPPIFAPRSSNRFCETVLPGPHDLDTLRVERETFAEIMRAWQDGFTKTIAENTALSEQEIRDTFKQIVADILNPERYAVWHVPVISARSP